MAGNEKQGWVSKLKNHNLERLTKVAFCDKASCFGLASWKIAYGGKHALLCSPHTVALMRERKIWGPR
jgi:hypothetical protein